jgi:transposase-like protein
MGKKMKERRVYTEEFKAGAAALAGKREKPVRHIALDLGINENQLYRRIQRSKAAAGGRLPAFPGPAAFWVVDYLPVPCYNASIMQAETAVVINNFPEPCRLARNLLSLSLSYTHLILSSVS